LMSITTGGGAPMLGTADHWLVIPGAEGMDPDIILGHERDMPEPDPEEGTKVLNADEPPPDFVLDFEMENPLLEPILLERPEAERPLRLVFEREAEGS